MHLIKKVLLGNTAVFGKDVSITVFDDLLIVGLIPLSLIEAN